MNEKTMKKKTPVGIITSIGILAIGVISIGAMFYLQKVNANPVVTVYKSPACGCCSKWVAHMEANGFTVNTVDLKDLTIIKKQYGITRDLASCHTAIVDGYIIEGHVPASDVQRLLAEKPDVIGLSAPGMPTGSPGMEIGNKRDQYNVVTFDKDGNVAIFERH